jgi:lysophospholipase L1-like esterase
MKRVLVVLAALALSLVTSVPAFAEEDESSHDYLALGDSVAFGYTPRAVTPAQNYFNAANFVGYPEMVARALELKDNNSSCPGEATGGFISLASTNDNGCLTGYRLRYPLHVAYTTSQLDFAVAFLNAHRSSTKLVSINLGANDLFHLQTLCSTNANPGACFGARLPGVLATMQANLGHIFAALRATGYHNKIVALTYYALVYDLAGAQGAALLNQPMINAAQPFHVRIASGFDAFKPLALLHGGSSCAAGLIIALPAAAGGGCDVHPTQLGHALLAAAVVQTAFGEDDSTD